MRIWGKLKPGSVKEREKGGCRDGQWGKREGYGVMEMTREKRRGKERNGMRQTEDDER